MCTLCGCGVDNARTQGGDPPQDHHRDAGHHHDVGYHHAHGPSKPRPADAGLRIRIERDLLAENNRFADANRAFLARRRAIALNLLSSPGSGKTTLLERTIADLQHRLPIAVIEGDQETTFDTDRVCAAGVRAIQINTGKICHLDAHMVGHALSDLDPPEGAVVFIENVGNLVCPSAFDLGEARKVVLLSVTEGDDKPRKYRDMFAVADLLLITKIDLLPYVRFDLTRCRDFARAVNPEVRIIDVSAVNGAGLESWYAWLASCGSVATEQAPAAIASV